MLDPNYHAYTIHKLGRFLNHDDSVGERELESEFRKTQDACRAAYKQPFMAGGSDKPKGMLRNVFGRLKGKGKHAEEPSADAETPTAPSWHITTASRHAAGLGPTGRAACIGGHVRNAYYKRGARAEHSTGDAMFAAAAIGGVGG